MAILLEIAAASDAHTMWERRLNELCRMYERQPCFVDRDGKWGLRDFLDYAREAMGCVRDSDGSGEADKTGTGLAEGDSAGRETASPNQLNAEHPAQARPQRSSPLGPTRINPMIDPDNLISAYKGMSE